MFGLGNVACFFADSTLLRALCDQKGRVEGANMGKLAAMRISI